eukprot:gnl/MRDRNA2_/MRDRNA2_150561_c0_seq1.p1 gnl/MRDRNA2_/MRDRNA2_150561_c0~~gnl/MRDRNA2_/MRDRNA2_150561_c0_seq1.p1  ORF type:complete len:416 (+),score=75.94 gnl/MRDRNA2_/MRDRNA2_150561_c0_seq1:57-1304(+)
MTRRILVVGAGLTGAVAGRRLRKALGQTVEIECWEYLNDSGGRLGTTKDQGIVADVATSVISLDMRKEEVQELEAELCAAGLLHEVKDAMLVDTPERPTGSEWRHFLVPDGTTAVVNYLVRTSKVKVKTNACVDWCSIDSENWKWYVESNGGKGGGRRQSGTFDAVILCNGPTHPGCERMDNIWGEWQDFINPKFWNALRNVTWSSCYVVTLSLTSACHEACDWFFGEKEIQRSVNDDLIQYVTYESRKRSNLTGNPSSGVVVVCHTTAEAMWSYKRAQCVQAVQDRVLKDYLKIPRNQISKVVHRAHSRCWGKCQVTSSISELMGKEVTHSASSATDSPPLALCGDYFLGPTCTDAVVSATAAADAISDIFGHAVPAKRPRAELKSRAECKASAAEKLSFAPASRRRWGSKRQE